MPVKTFRKGKVPTLRATTALEQLHAELAGKLVGGRQEVERLVEAMKHVEAVLKLLQPGYRLNAITVRRRQTNRWFKRGTALRHVLEVLREAEEPLTPREITKRMLKQGGVDNPDPVEFYRLSKSVQSALHSHKGDSIIAHSHLNRRAGLLGLRRLVLFDDLADRLVKLIYALAVVSLGAVAMIFVSLNDFVGRHFLIPCCLFP
jgi:hypothetical protein